MLVVAEPQYKTSEGRELLGHKTSILLEEGTRQLLENIQSVQEEVETWRSILLANKFALEQLVQKLIRRSRKNLDLRVDKFVFDAKNLTMGWSNDCCMRNG